MNSGRDSSTGCKLCAHGQHICYWLTRGWTVRKECRVLTLRAKAALGLLVVLAAVMATPQIYPFLAITQPVGANVLIVEGWIPERAFIQIAELYRRRAYDRVLVVVSVYEGDDLIDESGLFYDQHVRSLTVKQGLPAASVRVILCPATRRDRTYHCARVARRWLIDADGVPQSIDVATLGPHARRSRLLYEKAFGTGISVGVLALVDQTYDAKYWWRYSAGFRDVLSEAFSYFYARVVFRPPDPPHDDAPFKLPENPKQP